MVFGISYKPRKLENKLSGFIVHLTPFFSISTVNDCMGFVKHYQND